MRLGAFAAAEAEFNLVRSRCPEACELAGEAARARRAVDALRAETLPWLRRRAIRGVAEGAETARRVADAELRARKDAEAELRASDADRRPEDRFLTPGASPASSEGTTSPRSPTGITAQPGKREQRAEHRGISLPG